MIVGAASNSAFECRGLMGPVLAVANHDGHVRLHGIATGDLAKPPLVLDRDVLQSGQRGGRNPRMQLDAGAQSLRADGPRKVLNEANEASEQPAGLAVLHWW